MDAIYFEKNGQKKLVASNADQERIMVDQQLDIALNEAGSMEFSLPITSLALSEISFLNGEVTFERSGIELFRGELHGNTENMLRTGSFKAKGALSYLEGLQMDPYEYAGSVEGYFTMLLNHYNDRASEWRKIQPGIVTVEDANDYILRSNSGRVNYLKLLQEKLVDRLGGYLWLRVENGIKYLDYLAEINLPAGQDVKYGQNIVDIEQGIEYQDVYTVLIPEGKEDEETGKKLSVESVNNGSPYVINQAALAKYGRRETVISFPDVTVAENLLTKAQKALASYANPVKNVRVKAVDMAMWTDAKCFQLGQSIYTKSEYHGIEDTYILSKMQIRSLKPESEILELGELRRTYTQLVDKKVNAVDDELQELKDKVNQQDVTADSAKSITLTADTYVFKYDSAGSLTGATEANLLARAQNVTIDRWQYKNDSGTWVDYPDTEDNSSIKGNSLKVKPNHPVFFGDAACIKILSNKEDVYDTLTITKLRDGSDGDGIGGLSVILGNEAQTIACGSDGAVSEEVIAEIPFAGYVGTTQVPCECTVGTLPAGVTLSRNQASASGTEGQVWFRFAAGATLGGKPNGTIPLTFTLSERKVQKQFSWSKSCTGDKGDKGDPGEKGEPGTSGKTLYTWIKYADTPTSGMSDNPDGKAYIGIAYNKETQTESTNYSDYTWSKTEGKQGVPGEPGEDGTTTYTWIKYADDATGKNMSDNPEGKEYIGMAYNKTTQTESSNASDYTWSKFRGDDGVPGRTYILESDVQVVKKGANDVLSPKSIIFSAYYRDGDTAARTAYAGRFRIYESTTDTSTWSLKYQASSNQSSKTHTISSANVKYVKCVLYAAGGTTTEITSVVVNVIEDAEGAVDEIDKMLTQKEIFNRLTNNGEAQGMYYDESTGDLYINASYIVSGILSSINGETWINLEDGTFSFANEQLTYEPGTGLKISGNLIADGKITIRQKGWDDAIIEYVLDEDYYIVTDASYDDALIYNRTLKLFEHFYNLEINTTGIKIDNMIANIINCNFIDATKVDTSYLYADKLYARKAAILRNGSYVHTAKGTSGTSGYVKIAQIKIKKEYVNTPITMGLFQRGMDETNIFIRFANENNTDPAIEKFTYNGNPQVYMVKSTTSTWDLYVKKSETYDKICVTQLHTSAFDYDGIAIEWTDVQASSLPYGYVSATLRTTDDTGWIAVSSFLNSFSQASTAWESKCKYRKIGNHVYLKGCVKTPSSWTGSTPTTVLQLPDGYRPKTRVYKLTSATGGRVVRFFADTDGKVMIDWTLNISDGSFASGELSWIQLDIDFLID